MSAKNRANGLRKGAHVHIIRPAHNSRRLGIEDNDYSKSGVVTREGSSANGGWFEILLDGGGNKYVYYRRGSLEVIHHGPDGQPLPTVPIDELPHNPSPPSPRARRTSSSGQKRKPRPLSDSEEEYMDEPTIGTFGLPHVQVRDRIVRQTIPTSYQRKNSILENTTSLFDDEYSNDETSDSEEYSDDDGDEASQQYHHSKTFAMLGRVTVPQRHRHITEHGMGTPSSVNDESDTISLNSHETGTDVGLLSPTMGATPIFTMPSPAPVNLIALSTASPGFGPLRVSLATPSPLPNSSSPYAAMFPCTSPNPAKRGRKSSIPSRSLSAVEPSFASSRQLWAL